MGHHHRFGPRTERGLDPFHGWHVGAQLDVHKHRHGAILNDGIDGRRKTGGHRDDFIPGLDSAVL